MIIAGRSRCRCSQHRSLGETISNYSSCRLLCSIAAVTAAAGAILDDFYMHKTRSWHDFFSCVNLVFESHNSFLRYKFSAGTKNFHRGGSTAKGAAQQHSSGGSSRRCSAAAEAAAAEGSDSLISRDENENTSETLLIFFWLI